jgi:hypothetical protein
MRSHGRHVDLLELSFNISVDVVQLSALLEEVFSIYLSIYTASLFITSNAICLLSLQTLEFKRSANHL